MMHKIDLERLARQTLSHQEAEEVCNEIEALRADLEAVAVAAWEMSEAIAGSEEQRNALREALARPGVRKVLDQATSRAAATS